MAGLTPRESVQFDALLELRRRLSFRRFKGRPQEAFATILFLLFAIPIPLVLAILSVGAYARLPAPWNAELLCLVLTMLWLLWLLAPVFGASLNETPDLRRLLVLPIRRRVLIAAAFAGAIYDYSALLSIPFLAAALFAWIKGPAVIVAPLAILLAGAHLLVAGQLTGTLFGALARSRRIRDFATVAGSLLALGMWWLQMRSHGFVEAMRQIGRRAVDANVHPLDILQWTPPGASARAVERAAAGATGAAWVWLLGSACALALLTLAWWNALDRVTTRGDFTMGGAGRRRAREKAASHGNARRGFRLGPATELAIAKNDLRLVWRSPRRRAQMLQGVLMPVLFGVIWFGGSTSHALLTLLPAMFVAMLVFMGYSNVVAQDGRGVAALFLSPLDRAAFFRGKVLSFAVVSVVPIAGICLITAWKVPGHLALVATLLAAGTFLVATAVSSSVSARVAIRQPEDDRSFKPVGTSAAGWMIAFVQPLAMVGLYAPVWIPVLVGVLTGRTRMAAVVSTAGLVYGWLVFRFAMRDAGRALLAHEPEMFQTLELGRGQ